MIRVILIALLSILGVYQTILIDDLETRNKSLNNLAESNEDEIVILQSRVKELDVPCPAPPICLPQIIEGPEKDVYYSQCNDDCPRCDGYEN